MNPSFPRNVRRPPLLREMPLSFPGTGSVSTTPAATASAIGGSVRIALEDNLLITRRKLAASNTQQEAKTGRIIEDHRAEVAEPDDDTRKMRAVTLGGSTNT